MRILYHFRTQGTGAEGVHIAGIATALERLGHEVVFSSPTGVDPRTRAGVNPFAKAEGGSVGHRFFRWVARRAPRLLFESLEIAYNLVAGVRNCRLLAQHGCELIYERHAFFLVATAWLAARRKLPFILEINELAGDERVRAHPVLLPLARWADRFTARWATVVIVVSPHLRRRLEALGVAPEKILVLPNAVDETVLTRTASPTALRARLGLEEEAIVLSFIGWFVPWHRLDRLLAEFAVLAVPEPRLRLLLVGDGPLREALAAQATTLQISGQVIFAGAVPHAEIPEVLAASAISIVPHANAYRSPIKLFEAMAAGCAVLAPRVEPITAVLRHEENGLLFDPEQAGDLRVQMARLVDDAGLCRRLGEQARATVAAHHTWRQNALASLRLAAITHPGTPSFCDQP